MYLLDTDHLTVLRYPEHSLHEQFLARINDATDQDFHVCVISLEEQLRGWLAEIRRHAQKSSRQVPAYSRLAALVEYYNEWTILPFGDRESVQFEELKSQRIRIGSQDLKIAAIAMTHGATLLSANLVDFRQVPALVVEDWLYGRSKPK